MGFGTSPFSGTCQLGLLERLESSHSAVWSSVPGPGDESLTGHPPPSSLALSVDRSNLLLPWTLTLVRLCPGAVARKLLAKLERSSNEKGWCLVPTSLNPRGAREQAGAARSRQESSRLPGQQEN